MHIRRHRSPDSTPRTNSADAVLDETMNLARDLGENESRPMPKPIISVHGRDVHEDDIDPKNRKPEPSRRAA